MRTLLLLAIGCLAFGCSSSDSATEGGLKAPPAPNTSTGPGIADPNRGVSGVNPGGSSTAAPGTPGAQMPTPGATGG
jgi:hypothetical protein